MGDPSRPTVSRPSGRDSASRLLRYDHIVRSRSHADTELDWDCYLILWKLNGEAHRREVGLLAAVGITHRIEQQDRLIAAYQACRAACDCDSITEPNQTFREPDVPRGRLAL